MVCDLIPEIIGWPVVWRAPRPPVFFLAALGGLSDHVGFRDCGLGGVLEQGLKKSLIDFLVFRSIK